MTYANTSRELIIATLPLTAWNELSYRLQRVLNRYANIHLEKAGENVNVQIQVIGGIVNFEIIHHALVSERDCEISYAHSTASV